MDTHSRSAASSLDLALFLATRNESTKQVTAQQARHSGTAHANGKTAQRTKVVEQHNRRISNH